MRKLAMVHYHLIISNPIQVLPVPSVMSVIASNSSLEWMTQCIYMLCLFNIPQSATVPESLFDFHDFDYFKDYRTLLLLNISHCAFSDVPWCLDSNYSSFSEMPQVWCWVLPIVFHQVTHSFNFSYFLLILSWLSMVGILSWSYNLGTYCYIHDYSVIGKRMIIQVGLT
jgi:hypothetical protein